MNYEVIIFRTKKIKSGGEKYLSEVHNYLQNQKIKVTPLWIDDLPKSFHRLGLLLDCFFSNLLFTLHYWRLENLSDNPKIFFEDFQLHPRLWLFNFLIRLFIRNGKIVVLAQEYPYYHNALNNSITKGLDELLISIFFKQAQLVLCNSKYTLNQVFLKGTPKYKLHLVYCGYDSGLWPRQRKQFKNSINKYHILFVGSCTKLNGLEYLIEAFYMLKNNKIILDIVGNTEADPMYFKLLEKQRKNSKIKDNIIFHGYISDKDKLACLYMKSDIFVLPSLVHGFGIVLLEAMSFGLPILATNASAIPELVKNDVNGLLVPPANPEALAAAIHRLIIDPDLCNRYGQAGYNFIFSNRSFYSWPAVGERILKAFDTISLT